MMTYIDHHTSPIHSLVAQAANLIARVDQLLAAAWGRHRRDKTLSELRNYDERLLRDIGLTRADLLPPRRWLDIGSGWQDAPIPRPAVADGALAKGGSRG
jgi:uncharacterized protein YjiS (DUF1127 family)